MDIVSGEGGKLSPAMTERLLRARPQATTTWRARARGPRAAGRSWGSRAAPGAYRLGQRARPGLTFPEVPSPSTTIFSCRSWLSSSESDMLSREPGLPPPTPRGRGRKGRRRGPGPGKGGRAAVGAEPPARVPEPPPEKSAQITRRAPSCPPCRPLPSPRRGHAPFARRRTRPPSVCSNLRLPSPPAGPAHSRAWKGGDVRGEQARRGAAHAGTIGEWRGVYHSN